MQAGDGSAPHCTGKPKRIRPRALPELALVVVLFLVYKAGRVAADGHVGKAFANESRIWRLERWLHLPSEVGIQHGLLSSETLVHVANCYYAWVHFLVSAAFLIWIYVRRPAHYVPLRRLMALVTAAALVVHVSFPLAPPRMISGLGMLDTAAVFGPSVYGPPSSDTLSNQYAAMPSLHVGWALIVAVGLIRAIRTRWRWLWALYPIATFAVVVGTANHYWMDGLVAITMVAAIAPIPGVLRAGKPSLSRFAPSAPAATCTVIAAFAAMPPARLAAMAGAVPRPRDGADPPRTEAGTVTRPRNPDAAAENGSAEPQRSKVDEATAMSRIWI